MHSVMFVATVGPTAQAWDEFVAFVDNSVKTTEHVIRLSENIWLLHLAKSKIATAALGTLIYRADAKGVSYGILPFEHAPEWLPGGFDPKSMPRRP